MVLKDYRVQQPKSGWDSTNVSEICLHRRTLHRGSSFKPKKAPIATACIVAYRMAAWRGTVEPAEPLDFNFDLVLCSFRLAAVYSVLDIKYWKRRSLATIEDHDARIEE